MLHRNMFVLFLLKQLSAKDKHIKEMRYEYTYLIDTTLLFMKSYSTFKFLRESKMLPLPGPTTQRKLLRSSECAFGFNQLALDAIFKKLKGVKDIERWITLMLDEMTCTKELEFCTKTLKWKGIVDFGGDLHIQVLNEMCVHVFVFFSAQVFKA